jgi:hypothetical protein
MPSLDYYIKKIPANAPPELRRAMIEEAKKKVLIDVFGEGYKIDKNGRAIEQGLGSASNMSSHSVAAYEARCKHEVGYTENLARMKRQLAECDARRKAAQATEIEF